MRRRLVFLVVVTLTVVLASSCTKSDGPEAQTVLRSGPTLSTAGGGAVSGASVSAFGSTGAPPTASLSGDAQQLGQVFDVTFADAASAPVVAFPLDPHLTLGTHGGHQVGRRDLVIGVFAPGPAIWIPLPTRWDSGTDTLSAVLPYDVSTAIFEPTRWIDGAVNGVKSFSGWALDAARGFGNAIVDDLSEKFGKLVDDDQQHLACSNPKNDWVLTIARADDKIKGCLDSARTPEIQFENDTSLPLDVGPAPTLAFKPKLDVGSYDSLEDILTALLDWTGQRMFIPAHGVATATWYDKGQTAGNFISLSSLAWAITSIQSTLQAVGFVPAAEVTEFTKVADGLLVQYVEDGTAVTRSFEVWEQGETTKLGLVGDSLERFQSYVDAAVCVSQAISSGKISRTFDSAKDAAEVVRTGIECASKAMSALGHESISGALETAIVAPLSDGLDTLFGVKSLATSFAQSVPLFGKFNGGPAYGLQPTPPTDLTDAPYFRTPDGHIWCGRPDFPWEGTAGAQPDDVLCRSDQNTLQPTSAACSGAGYERAPGLEMLPGDYAAYTCIGREGDKPMLFLLDGSGGYSGPRSPYAARDGERVDLGPVVCTVRTASVSCTGSDTSHHGFDLSATAFSSPLLPNDAVEAAGNGGEPDTFASAGAVRPTSFPLGRGADLTDLQWTEWTSTGATGTGTLAYNTCKPDCASANYETVPLVSVALTAATIVCGTWFFTRLEVVDPADPSMNTDSDIAPTAFDPQSSALCLPPSGTS